MCRNVKYTERGIKELDGYASQWWTMPAQYAVKVARHLGSAGVLTEPTSLVAKAWELCARCDRAAPQRP